MKRSVVAAVLVLGLVVPVFAESYVIDPVHTTVIFKIQHMGAGRFIGRFNATSGKLAWDEKDPSKSSIEVSVKSDSVDTANADRDNHIKGPDFFNAKQYPTISFKSSKVEKAGEHYTVTGDLTLHGETRPVTAKFEITGHGKHLKSGKPLIGFEATFKIKRSEFGMKQMVGPLGDEVDIIVGVEAEKE